MSEIKLAGALPRGHANGLGPIVMDLINHPDRYKVALVIIDCKKVETDTDTGEIIPTARIRRVEAITGSDRETARRLMQRALEKRTGSPVLPLDIEDEIEAAFVDAEDEARR